MKTPLRRTLSYLLALALSLSLASCGQKPVTEEEPAPGKQTYDASVSYTVDYEAPSSPQPAEPEVAEPATEAPGEEPSQVPPAEPPYEGYVETAAAEPAPAGDGGEQRERTVYDEEASYAVSYGPETGEPALTPYEGDAVATVEPLAGELLPQEESFAPQETIPAQPEVSALEGAGVESIAGLTAQDKLEEESALLPEEADALGSKTAPPQLTMADIQAMNPNSTVIDIYTNQGYLSTLVGKYYEGKVTNVEEGVQSIQGMAQLLGLSKGCDFFAVYSERNNTGYTFYTYQQRYAGYTMRYATLRIVVDPQGYTAGLSCSFVPNIGTAVQEGAITQEQAQAIVRAKYSGSNLTYYPEHTVRLSATFYNRAFNCWVVYTNNPEATASFDMPYLEHFVTTYGEYVTAVPTNGFSQTNMDVMDHNAYFAGVEVRELRKTVTLEDGSRREVQVPVSYNPKDGRFYLMDPSRRIAVAQYYDFNYRGTVNFITSDTLDGWSQNNLLAYANTIVVYDFYADHGIRSVDGFETPILITVGWCDENGQPVDNACFYGVNDGWACFGFSDINHYGDCVDVVGHEYTHGVLRQSAQGIDSRNETGAINEAYSDIMGNIIEMATGYTEDRNWLMGEKTGKVTRNMSNPNEHEQPAFVGDRYYTPPVLNPVTGVNDCGGIHANNSLLGHIAYLMDQSGMSYEQQFSMWLTAVEILTPKSDYEDLHGALLHALKINGMLSQYGAALNRAYATVGLDRDWRSSYLEATREGLGRVLVRVEEQYAQAASEVYFYNEEGWSEGSTFPDENGFVSLLLPPGTYRARLVVTGDKGTDRYNYTGSGWVKNGSFSRFEVRDGGVTKLVGTDGKPLEGESAGLNLISFNAGYFSMLIPEGWRIEVCGEYASTGIKIFDPNDPSTQMFFYGALRPLHKSEATRKFWKNFDYTGQIVNGPVLPQVNVLGLLGTWSYDIAYQKYYDRQIFTDLTDFKVLGAYTYNGPCHDQGGIESAAFVSCATNWEEDCRMLIATALVDEDYMGLFGGNYFYTARGTTAILAPAERYDAVFEDLMTCFASIRFSDSYIIASQGSEDPMSPQYIITQNFEQLASVMTEIYSFYR